MIEENAPVGVPLSKPLEEAAVQAFAAEFRGALVRPGDEAYDAERAVFNAIIDRHPALIARCTGVADVIAAVNFAREEGLVVAVRGGGTPCPATLCAKRRRRVGPAAQRVRPCGGGPRRADVLYGGSDAGRFCQPPGRHNYWKAENMAQLSDEATDTMGYHGRTCGKDNLTF